jgi:hypothetical protein
MAQQSRSTVDIEASILECEPVNNNGNKPEPKTSLLKTLRERKKLSRGEIARRTRLSTYQVEGLEGQNTEKLLGKFLTCTTAMGYKTLDVLTMMAGSLQDGKSDFPKGTIGRSLSEKIFQGGVKLHTYLDRDGYFLGLLEVQMGHSIEMEKIYTGDLTLGIVREGILTVDFMTNQTAHKKDGFFILPGKIPIKFINEDGYLRTAAVLLFSVKFPPPQGI